MKLNKFVLSASLFLCFGTWASASTYYGGFEDTVGGDYDYNDIVFSLSGSGLMLNSATGQWNQKPTLGTSGTPFWNHSSFDGTNENVGYCIYGGGNCGTALDSTAKYLATSTGTSVKDVYFSDNSSVDTNIYLKIAADTNKIGWFLLSSPNTINWLTSANGGSYSFDPGANFGIAAENVTTGQIFYSDSSIGGQSYGTLDNGTNHLAWFGDAPEPAEWGLMGLGLIGVGTITRFRKTVLAKQ